MKIIRSINIEKEIWERLQKLAEEEKRSASNMIEMLILKYEKEGK